MEKPHPPHAGRHLVPVDAADDGFAVESRVVVVPPIDDGSEPFDAFLFALCTENNLPCRQSIGPRPGRRHQSGRAAVRQCQVITDRAFDCHPASIRDPDPSDRDRPAVSSHGRSLCRRESVVHQVEQFGREARKK